MKTLDLQYGAGSQQVFIDLTDGRVYNTSRRMSDGRSGIQELIDRFGGRQYYRSRTDLSGAGFLDFSKRVNTLKEIGYVVVDDPVHDNMREGLNLMFSRWSNDRRMEQVEDYYGGIFLHNNQLVISCKGDDNRWGFTPPTNICEFEVKFTYVTVTGEPATGKWTVHYDGAGRLYDQMVKELVRKHRLLRLWQRVPEDALRFDPDENRNKFEIHNQTHWYLYGEWWVHTRLIGGPGGVIVVDDIRDNDPIETTVVGEYIPRSSWVKAETEIFYLRRGDGTIELQAAFCGMEYEQLVEEVEYFRKPEIWHVKVLQGLQYKLDEDRAYKEHLVQQKLDEEKELKKVQTVLEETPEQIWTLEDSRAAGNCDPGTTRFMEAFGLREPMTSREILEHRHFSRMLQDVNFRRVILRKENPYRPFVDDSILQETYVGDQLPN